MKELKHDLELEAELKKIGFKKKWLDDKSGYWLELPLKIKGKIPGRITVESDYKTVFVEIQTYDYFNRKLKKANMELIEMPKCDLKSIKSAIRFYSK